MAPLVMEFKKLRTVEVEVCVTAQHRSMLDQVLQVFDIVPDYDLNIMKEGQTLGELTGRMTIAMEALLDQVRPDWVFVHGDTTTTFATSLAAFYKRIKVAHVEAGLRTFDIQSPWPEEANRQLTAALTELHFAPTEAAATNLIHEGFSKNKVFVTGNTVIDALLWARSKIATNGALRQEMQNSFSFLNSNKKTLLVTGHRRENFGPGFESICRALHELSQNPEIQIVYPVHLNPHVREPVNRLLAGLPNVHLIEPLSYLSFVHLMDRSYLILTDSGGIQEEAPSLGKPVLVLRDTTERPDAVAAGAARLVGTSTKDIVSTTQLLLEDSRQYNSMSNVRNPYGDGTSSTTIVNIWKNQVGVLSSEQNLINTFLQEEEYAG